MGFWRPIASMVTTSSVMSINTNSRGIVVISLLFASVASCPSTR